LFPAGAPRFKGSNPHISLRKLDSVLPDARIIVFNLSFSSGMTTISITYKPLGNFRIAAAFYKKLRTFSDPTF
jgi:hypothetical protein